MVRRICTNCSHLSAVSMEEQLSFEREMGERRTQFLYGDGCNVCAQTGYLGRFGIYEVMILSEDIRRMILDNEPPDAIRAQAINEGMISLWRDGMTKVQSGLTTPYEIIRNVFTAA